MSPQELAAIEAQLSSNPAILRAIQADQQRIGGRAQYLMGRGQPVGDSGLETKEGRANILRQYGIEFPDAGDYQILVDPSGQVKLQRQNWFQRNADWILPVATIGTAGIVTAATAGPAAATGAAPAASAGPAGAGAAPIAAPATGGTLPATVLGNGATGTVAGGTGITGGAATSGGVLSTLKNYGKGALDNAGDLGTVLSSAAAGSAEGRRRDADQNRQNAIYNRDLPAVRTGQVARGEVLSTMQDAAPTGDPRIDKFRGGGLRPSAFGPQSRQAGGELARQSLSNLMNPDQDRLKPSGAGMGENLAAGAGLGLSIFDLLRKYGRS